MNSEMIVGMIRQFLPFIAGIATILGWNKAGQFDAIGAAVIAAIGPLMALGSLIWSLISKTDAALVTTAANVPGVSTITLSPTPAGTALAANTPANVGIAPVATKPL